MTELLERAVEAARNLTPTMQDDIARFVLELVGDETPSVTLTDEERAAIAHSKAAAARGEFASDEQVRAVWAKHRLWSFSEQIKRRHCEERSDEAIQRRVRARL